MYISLSKSPKLVIISSGLRRYKLLGRTGLHLLLWTAAPQGQYTMAAKYWQGEWPQPIHAA